MSSLSSNASQIITAVYQPSSKPLKPKNCILKGEQTTKKDTIAINKPVM